MPYRSKQRDVLWKKVNIVVLTAENLEILVPILFNPPSTVRIKTAGK